MKENIETIKALLLENKEQIAAEVHNAWWDEKKRQGFHPPVDCMSQSAKDAHTQDIKSLGYNAFMKFYKYCDKCHPDMCPYKDLPEEIKDYDRVTVQVVIDAIK